MDLYERAILPRLLELIGRIVICTKIVADYMGY
jgi:hypothetical protein